MVFYVKKTNTRLRDQKGEWNAWNWLFVRCFVNSTCQLSIKACQSFVIKPVWANSKENTPVSILLVSDNGITKVFGEYEDTEEDENTLFTFLLFMEAEEISYRGITMGKKIPNLKFKLKVLLTC